MNFLKRRGWLVALMGLVLCLGTPLHSQTAEGPSSGKIPAEPPSGRKGLLLRGSEKGSFKIVVDGEPQGTEDFELAPSGDHFVFTGSIHLTVVRGDRPVNYLIETELQLKPNYDPIHYSMVQKYAGNAATIKIDFDKGKAHARFDTGSGVETRDYSFPADVTILDDNVFHHYILLARRYDYDRGGLQEFYAFIPQESIGGILHITLKGDEKIEVNGKSVAVQHLLVDTKDLQLDLYVQGPNHRLVKLVVPSSNVVVERTS